MTQEIIAMAREAGFTIVGKHVQSIHGYDLDGDYTEELKAFAALVTKEAERKASFNKAELWLKRINAAVLAEREACALVCIDIANKPSNVILGVAIDCAAAIRART